MHMYTYIYTYKSIGSSESKITLSDWKEMWAHCRFLLGSSSILSILLETKRCIFFYMKGSPCFRSLKLIGMVLNSCGRGLEMSLRFCGACGKCLYDLKCSREPPGKLKTSIFIISEMVPSFSR